MKNNHLDLLKALSTAVGISGYEHDIRALLRDHCASYVDTFQEDPLGNLIMFKKGAMANDDATPRRSIMLAAHTDEIGGIVTHIERGFIHFTNVGGLDKRLLMGQEVTVFGRKPLQGIIASLPPHFSDVARDQYPDIEAYQIDVGMPAETVAANIQVGDLVVIAKKPTELLGGLITGKALDDRASVVAMVICLAELTRLTHQWDVYAVATSQEEVGLHGAKTSAYRLQPDVAIAIDVTFADSPGVANGYDIALNKGPVLTQGANLHPVVTQKLKDTASQLEMGTQLEFEPGGTGTDAWAIQTSQNGIPTALIGLPLRYMHSPVETVSPNDIERTGRLMAHFIASLTEEFIAELTPTEGLEES